MNITNISKNKRRLKRIVYGSFLLGSFFEITTAAHASAPGTSSFDLTLYYELVQRVESGDIEGISRVLAAIGDEKAQIDALLAPFFDPWTPPWSILFRAARYGDLSVLITLLAPFRNHSEDLLRDKDTYTTVLSCIFDFFQWQSRLFHEEDILDLSFDIVATEILSDDARKKAFKEILMREIDRSGGDPLIRQVGKHFGPELEAELIKYKRQVDEFPADCRDEFDEDSED